MHLYSTLIKKFDTSTTLNYSFRGALLFLKNAMTQKSNNTQRYKFQATETQLKYAEM